MYAPALFRERSRAMQIVLGGLVPTGIGALAGVLVGASAAAYSAVALLAALGGFAKVSLGSLPPLLAVVTTIIGMPPAAAGGRIARAPRERAGSLLAERGA